MLGQSGDVDKEKELKFIEETRKKKCCATDCLNKFPIDVIYSCREECRELQLRCDQHVSHLHLVVLGHMDACLHDSEQTSCAKKKNVDRSRTRLTSTFHGVPVCSDAFHFVHGISRRVTRDLKQQFEQHGLKPRVHGNVEKTSLVKALSFEVRANAVKFIENYAVTHALVLPGRTAGTKNPDVLLLPCGTTKAKVHELYVQAGGDQRSMSYSLFCRTWSAFLPGVHIQRPRTDLCATCKQDTLSLQKLRSLDDEARAELLSRSLRHLDLVAQQRDHYKSSIAAASATVPDNLKFGDTADATVMQHFSFDFAQQIFIPNSSQQVGPLYFLVPYKLALFGIICEPLGKMVIYVIPEAILVSKGSNMVVSLLHHFLGKYAAGVTQITLNADNCVGQNKNNTVLQYLMWRVITGLSTRIELAFMVAGHTKFSPDYGFGVFKKLYRHSELNSVEEVCAMMGRSSLLVAEPVGTEQDAIIPCYDWQAKFASAGKIVGLKQFHHFGFDTTKPGVCMVRQYARSQVTEIQITHHDTALSPDLPPVIVPTGLSHARQEYLYTKIRQYVSDEYKDTLCPVPTPAAVEEEVAAAGSSKQLTSGEHQAVDTATAITQTGRKTATQAASKVSPLVTRSIAVRGHAAQAEVVPVASGLGRKRTAPTCQYCHEQGHRNSVRGGKFLCPKRRAESSNV